MIRAVAHADVVMLNEATEQQFRDVLRGLGDGFRLAAGRLKQGNYDGSWVVYNEAVFEAVDTFVDVVHKSRAQVVVATRLRHRPSGRVVRFVSLHLKSGYGDKEPLRRRQMKAALAKVRTAFGPLGDGEALVVAGDLNSDYRASYARLVREDAPKHGLRNAASLAKASTKPPSSALVSMRANTPTYNHHHRSAFDYVLVSPWISVRRMYTEATQSARAPNASQGSDHFPVTAELVLGGA